MTESEPMCEPEEVTLESLEDAVAHWEKSVEYIGAGFDCSDEYTHDLFSRDILHGVINGFANQRLDVPDALRERVKAADKKFLELTFEIDNDVWGSTRTCYDKTIFWYYYRWPNK